MTVDVEIIFVYWVNQSDYKWFRNKKRAIMRDMSQRMTLSQHFLVEVLSFCSIFAFIQNIPCALTLFSCENVIYVYVQKLIVVHG